MIELIDNLNYSGSKPNFKRDDMSKNEMNNINEKLLDKGHIVFCTDNTSDRGHYVYIGDVVDGDSVVPKWTRLTDASGNIIGVDIQPIPEEDIDELNEDLNN